MSIRLRLALCYGGLTGLIALAICGVVYAVHGLSHYDAVDIGLQATAMHVAEEYFGAPTAAVRAHVLGDPFLPGVTVRIYDGNGQILATTPNSGTIPQIPPKTTFAQPRSALPDPLLILSSHLVTLAAGPGDFSVDVAQGQRWRIYAQPAGPAGDAVETVTSLAITDRATQDFRLLIVFLAFAGMVISLLVAWLLAGSALRPVAALREIATVIARSGSFQRRVPVRSPNDELGRLATTFNEMLARLEQAYQAERRFVADASHELRAPLTAIQANLDLLEQRPQLPATERIEIVTEAGRESQRLTRLVGDLLALARADAGQALRRQRVELDRLTLDAVREARHLLIGQRLRVGTLEPAIIEGDPDRLMQLVLILLDNAIKYTPDDGEVVVDLRHRPRHTQLTIRDSGIGVPPEALSHVFERFYRADPARRRDPGGSGLGLPIARWIVDQHGGSITLASTGGKGTIVTVELPLPE